jgi:signal transduction histidine kinase
VRDGDGSLAAAEHRRTAGHVLVTGPLAQPARKPLMPGVRSDASGVRLSAVPTTATAMTTTPQTPEAQFRADAAVVWRLGSELFTTADQALLELIKNSYDAEARSAKLRVVPPTISAMPDKPANGVDAAQDGDATDRTAAEDPADPPDSAAAQADNNDDREDDAYAPPALLAPREEFMQAGDERGSIRLIDDGLGMDRTAIIRGWLTLSSSMKADLKRLGVPKGRRVPLGDKGLGRLGAQRLGDLVRLRTRPVAKIGDGPTIEHVVTIDWRQFRQGRLLDDVVADWEIHDDLASTDPWPGKAAHGTVLEIRGMSLSELAWTDEGLLEAALSGLVNPYHDIDRFRLRAYIRETPVDVTRVAREVRRAALAQFTATYTGEVLTVSGTLRPQWFRPNDPQRRKLLANFLATNDGRSDLADRIRGKAPEYDLSITDDEQFAFTHRSWPAELEGFPSAGDSGPFSMALDVVSLEFALARDLSMSVFDRQADYRRWIKDKGGVSVYRDGFIVSGGADLLDLGRSFTSGGSYYGLRPQNVLGYLAISARDNPGLQETTSREDFVRNPAFEHFDAVVKHTVKTINRFLDPAGRESAEFAKELSDRALGLFGLTEDELVQQATTISDRARTALAAIGQTERFLDTVPTEQLDAPTRQALDRAREGLDAARQTLEQADRLRPVVENLTERIREAQMTYDDLLSTAGLGLAAEGLAHDITQVMDRLRRRARATRRANDASSPDVALLLDEVEWAAGALRTQLRHLDPMLRYARLRRADVDLGKIARDLASFHADRLRDQGIVVEAQTIHPGTAWISAGRLAQVIDNLVHNSVYWLRSDASRHGDDPPRILLTADGNEITVTDNGPGVAEDLGDHAFVQYVTRKHEGRGLGLWLARQLLDLDSGTISLERTPDSGRLSTFRITFPETGPGGSR